MDSLTCLLNSRFGLFAEVFEMLWDRMDDRIIGSGLLDPLCKPLLLDQTSNSLELVRFDRSVVEVGRPAR